MKEAIILFLSIIALIISALWVYSSGFAFEPIIVFIMGIVGLLYHFLNRQKVKNKELKMVEQKLQNEQNVNVNVNVGNVEKKEVENIAQNKNETREIQIDAMKPKVHILFIDDDKNFNVVKILKDSGWKNTKSIVDIKGLDIPVVKESDIYFVDINGVGKLLNCEYEGLDVALMLKQKYPNKKVVIYSANKTSNSFHKAWDECDFKLEKNALPYQFQNLVEQYSLDLISQA